MKNLMQGKIKSAILCVIIVATILTVATQPIKVGLSEYVVRKVKVIPAPMQFWREFIGGVTDIIVFDPPEITEPVALVRDYVVLHEGEVPIPLEALTWPGTEVLSWEPIDTPEEPYLLPPDGIVEYDIPTLETDTAVLVRYTVAWAATPNIIETHFINEAILESRSPQVIVGQLSNFDVHNDYHEPVDNFELEIYGIQPSDILDWFPGWGAPPQINPIPPSGGLPGGTEIIWMDPDHPVMSCQWEHFGLHLKPGVIAVGIKAYWTQIVQRALDKKVYVELLKNGDFSSALDCWNVRVENGATVRTYDGPTWLTIRPLPPGWTDVKLINEPGRTNVLDIIQTVSDGDGDWTGVYQILNRDVSGFNELYFEADGKAMFQSLAGDGWVGGEYPVQFIITYKDINGVDHDAFLGWPPNPAWQQGFYYLAGNLPNEPYSNLVTQNVWFHYKSPNLMNLSPAPQTIKTVRLYSSGWAYHGRIDNAQLYGTPPSAELGDVIHIEIEVTVPTSETVTVVDTLPSDVEYISGTFTVDGAPATPTNEISYTLTAPGTHLIEFDCKVDKAYWEDREKCNVATATWYNEAGEVVDTMEDIECFTIHPFDNLVKDIHHDDWPMFHHDLALSGVSTSLAPNTNATLWIYDTQSSITSSPAVVDGKLYIGLLNGSLIALDANTGAPLWNYPTRGAIRSSPAVAYGKVYFLSTDGNIYALDADTGAFIWSTWIGTAGYPWASPAVHNGRVFIAGSGWVHSLVASTGAFVWSTHVGGQSNGPIAVVNGKVYSGTHNFDQSSPTLVALDELTGAIIWTYDYHLWHGYVGFINSNGVSVADGDGDGDLEVYFGVVTWTGPGPQAICLDEATGNEVWTQNINGWSTSTPAVHNGVVFIGSDDYNLYALNAGTGAVLWTYTTGAAVWSAPAVADGKVFVASLDHIFYAIDEATGNLVWKYDTSVSRMEGSPAVACGKVFVGNENGKVYAWGSPSVDALTIKEKTEVQWTIEIEVTNPFSFTMKNVSIKDNFGAELEIDGVITSPDICPDGVVDVFDLARVSINFGTFVFDRDRWDPAADLNKDGVVDMLDLSLVAKSLGLTLWTTGRSNKVHLYWYIGDLKPGETARIIILVSTDLNPAGHQEYTKPGVYEMNSGATLKFIDPLQNTQLSASTDSIYVTVLPLEDP